MAILTAAAKSGEPCPSNEALAAVFGFASVSGPVKILSKLERKKLIRVERFNSARVVEILATGARTATPRDTKPHWRERGGATHG